MSKRPGPFTPAQEDRIRRLIAEEIGRAAIEAKPALEVPSKSGSVRLKTSEIRKALLAIAGDTTPVPVNIIGGER